MVSSLGHLLEVTLVFGERYVYIYIYIVACLLGFLEFP